MSWSEEGFRARVAQRCLDLRRSKRSVLKAAGLAHDYLQTEPAHGRRVDNLEKLAAALDWSLAELMGLQAVSVNIELLLRAYRSMKRVTRLTGKREAEAKVWVLAMIYNLLQDAREEFADSNSGYEEYAAYVENTVYLYLTNPRYVDQVQKKIQQFQQSALSTLTGSTGETAPNTGLTDLLDQTLPDK